MSDRTVAHSPAAVKAETSSVFRSHDSRSGSAVVRLQRTLGNHAIRDIVQTRLIVGPAGDRYELEAERVAEEVMGMQRAQEQTPASTDPRIQRSCSSCGEMTSDDEPQNQPQIRRLCAHCEQEEEKTRRSPEHLPGPATQAPGPRSSLSEGELRSGGEPMPDPVRHFFESRFSRNFSDVRVHTGQQSETYNDTLHSYGFTFGNHIWLGRGQQPVPSLLMAHELAHVVQKHRPPHLHGGRALGQGLHQDHEPVVRRLGEPYWEPYEQTGELNHSDLLRDIGAAQKSTDFFTEAPIPNARTSTGNEGQLHSFDAKGQVDLYRAKTTIGAYFQGHGHPVALTQSDVSHPVMHNGAPFAHNVNSAPQVIKGALVNSINAPTDIAIGELKPNDRLKRFEGSLQLDGYKRGIELARREAQDKATPGDGANWGPVSVSRISGLTPPPQFTSPNFTNQRPRRLIIKGFGRRPVAPRTQIDGNLAVWESKTPGVWVYAWVPNTAITAGELPRGINRLAPVLKTKILDPLFEVPLHPAKMSRPGPSPQPAVTPEPKPVIRRMEATAPEKDTFDAARYQQWKSDRTGLTTDLEVQEKDPEFKAAETAILANRAQEHLRDSGLNVPEVQGARTAAQTVSKLEFWAGLAAGAFGFFRWVFGRAFVKVAQFFIKMRDKLRGFLKNLKIPTNGGFFGAVLKAGFKGLQLIAGFVIGKVANRIMQSLYTGVSNMIQDLIGPEIIDELAAKAERVEQIRAEIEQKVTNAIDAKLDEIFGVHLDDLKKLQEVLETFKKIEDLVSLVRWGARVIECLSPPAFGCLWILAEAALDFAAQKVAETCWFQKKIRPLLLTIDYVTTDLPNMLGDKVVGAIRALLPASIEGIFADLETGQIKPGPDEAVCDEGAGHGDFHEDQLHRDIDDLYVKIGEQRAQALQLLARKMKVPRDSPITAQMLSKLGDEVAKIDPAVLLQYAEQHPVGTGGGVPADLLDHVEKLESAVQAWDAGHPPPAPDPSAPKSPAPAAPDSPPDTLAGHKQEGGLPVVDAATRVTHETADQDIPSATVSVLNPSLAHTKGDRPVVKVVVTWNGRVAAIMGNVRTEVTDRTLDPPSAKSLETASGLLIHYHPLESYKILEVPGAIIPTKRPGPGDRDYTLRGKILTSIGERERVDYYKKQEAAFTANK